MLMMMPSLDLKSTLSIALQKSLVLAQCCVQQLCALCVYGVGFLCLMILAITAHTLLNGQHLHLTASIDGQQQMVLDLGPNTK
jgi:hypothetical protein